MSTVPSYLSDHQIANLRRLLEDVRSGYVRVPRFQRPFVWSDKQRFELLNSIKQSMPVGSLLVWRTTSFELKCFDVIGPYATPSKSAANSVTSYLLDGHQRLTTLFGLLNQPMVDAPPAPSEEDDQSIRWDIVYNLRTEEFVFANSKSDKRDPIIRLWPLLDNRTLSTELRTLQKIGADDKLWSEELWKTYEDRGYALGYAFQEYKLPVVAMVTDDLELATTTFQRINSQGTSMSEAHLVAALTWTQDFDLRERIDELRKSLPVAWHMLDEKLYLQVCKGRLGLDMVRTGQEGLISKLRSDHTLLDTAGALIQRSVSFLEKHAHVLGPELLPYSFQLLVLALQLEEYPPDQEPTEALLTWFWRTCWSGTFAGATSSIVANEREQLKQLCAGQQLPPVLFDALPERIDRRQARARTLVLRMLERVDKNRSHEMPAPSDEAISQLIVGLSMEGTDALPRIMTRPRLRDEQMKRLMGSPANRRLPLGFDDLHPFYDLVPKDAMEAYMAGNIEQFLQLRMNYLSDWDAAEAQRLCNPSLSDDLQIEW